MRLRIGLVLIGLAIAACGACDRAERTPDLTSCPPGDAAWSAAFERVADDPEARVELAIAAERAARACPERWEPLWLAGRIAGLDGDAGAAEASFGAALEAARRLDDPVGIARAADDLGWALRERGRLAEAERLYREAIDAADRAQRSDLAAFVRNNAVYVLLERGRFHDAARLWDEAEPALEDLGYDALVRFHRAALAIHLGDAASARATLERLYDDPGGDAWLKDAAAVVLGILHRALGDVETARSWDERVSDADPELAARARFGLAQAALARGELDRAARLFAEAVERLRDLDAALAFEAEVLAADVVSRRGDHARAAARVDGALARRGDDGGASVWLAHWIAGRIEARRGDDRAAAARFLRAIEALESQRRSLDPMSEGLYFLRERREPYVDAAAALLRAHGYDDPGAVAEAFRLSVLAHSRTLAGAVEFDASRGGSLDEAIAGLGAGEVMVDLLLGEESGQAIVASSRGAVAIGLAGRAGLAGPIERLRGALAASRADPAAAAARELAHALVEPIARALDRVGAGDARRLWIVPDGELALLPWPALPADSRPGAPVLAERFEIGLLPRPFPPRPGPAPEPIPVLLAGRPTFPEGSAFPPLPWSGFELSALAEIWRDAHPVTIFGEAFTRAALAAELARGFHTVHLATHAIASTNDPRRSGVILTGGDRLGVDEIARLGLDASTVVLSACRTGEGELVPGEGVIGLGWAFLRGGARAVVASHWTVDDRSTARLMAALHRRLRAGDDPALALARAQRERIGAGDDPRSWAAFAVTVRPGR